MKFVHLDENSSYIIYQDGRVYSKKKNMFLGKRVNASGYCIISIKNMYTDKITNYYVHRLVAKYFVDGYSETNCYVNHKDGNKTNNHYTNLEWCDMSYNTKQAYEMNLIKNGTSKKTYLYDNIRNIIYYADSGRKLALFLGCDDANIRHSFARYREYSISDSIENIKPLDKYEFTYNGKKFLYIKYLRQYNLQQLEDNSIDLPLGVFVNMIDSYKKYGSTYSKKYNICIKKVLTDVNKCDIISV